MARKCVLLMLAAAMLFASGCALPEPYALEDIQNILIIGVDMEDGDIKLTAVLDRIEVSSEPGKEQITTQVYVSTGETVFDAKRKLHAYSEKRASWFHLKYIIIGEEVAEQNIGDVLDFFCENDENRFLHRLIVSKGMSASDFLIKAAANNKELVNDLDALFKQVDQTGESSAVHLLDYAASCECKWGQLYIPTIELIDNAHYNSGESGDENASPIARLSGYALFRESQLACYLDAHQAMGLNFVINKIKSAEITVTDMHGHLISLEVVKSKASIKPKLDGAPSATISVVVDTFMVEYHDPTDSTSDEFIQYVEAQQSAYVTGIIASALEAAKNCGSDVFGIGSALHHAYPVKSEPYKENWNDIFSTMEIAIEVKSKVQCTYDMLNAPGR